MSINKQIQSLGKLYTIYEEVPESFLDGTHVASYFYHNILDIALIDNRNVWISKGSHKKSFAFKLFQFCNLKNQKNSFLKKRCQFPWKILQLIWTFYVSFWNNTIKL